MACAGPDLENRITMVVLIQILGFLPSILSAMAEEDEKRSSPLVHDFLHGDHDP